MLPPVLVTDSVLAAGLDPPCVALNDRLAGDTDNAGGVTGSTVSVTAIVFGDPDAPAAVTVTSVVYVPAARPLIDGVTVIVPALVPLPGERLSQLALSDAVQSIDPPPVLVTDSVLAAGLDPPCVALNDRLAGDTDNAGGVAGSTVSVTAIVFGDPDAPAAVTVTSVVYVPAARPLIDGVAVIVPALVPLPGERLSQLALSDAVQSIDPPPALLTDSVLAAGLDPPCVALNDRLAGDTDNTGDDATAALKTTVAIVHGVLAPVETRAAGVSPRSGRASSATNSMSEVGETLTRSL